METLSQKELSKFNVNINNLILSIPELIERIKSDRLEILELEKRVFNKKIEIADLEKSIEFYIFNAEKEVYNLETFKNEKSRKLAIKEILDSNRDYQMSQEFIKDLNKDIFGYLEKIEYLKIYLEYFKSIYEYKIILEKQKIHESSYSP